ncbi:MAG: hypothetical protein AB7E39_08185 [Endomicrobiaceae bacterium]
MPETELKKFDLTKKSIVVLSGGKIKNLREDGSKILYKDDIYVLDTDNILAFKENNASVCKFDDLTDGAVLVQDPYDKDLYVKVDNDNLLDVFKNNALKKTMIFSNLCSKLGAKKVILKQVSDSNNEADKNIKTKGNAVVHSVPIRGSIDYNAKLKTEIQKSLLLSDEFTGAEPDISGAKEYIKSKNLSNDLEMLSLIEAREGNNKLKKRELKITLNSDIKKNMSVIAEIGIPMLAQIQSKIQTITQSKKIVFMEVQVEF